MGLVDAEDVLMALSEDFYLVEVVDALDFVLDLSEALQLLTEPSSCLINLVFQLFAHLRHPLILDYLPSLIFLPNGRELHIRLDDFC